MSCRDYQEYLVPYIMNELSSELAVDVENHVASCGHCSARLARERTIQNALASHHAIPAPSPDFEQRVLAAAIGDSKGAVGRGWSTPVLVGAVAASLALGIALGLGVKPELDAGGEIAPEVAALSSETGSENAVAEGEALLQSQETLETVRLAFNARQAMNDVTLTLELPPNVELATFPGHQQLSWKVDLSAGENVLSLPLKVLFPGAGELVARLDDGKREKTFRATIPASLEGQAPAEGADTNEWEPAS